MDDWRDSQEMLVLEGRIKVPYGWSAGDLGTDYLSSLRDGKAFFGTRCPECGTVYHPPRSYCPDCFAQCTDRVKLCSEGVIETFTVVREHDPQLSPLPPPFGYGIVRLDGAGTGFLHLLGEFEDGELKSGMRVEAVFAEEREGSILDVRYFRPVREAV